MSYYREVVDECELQYEVACRLQRETQRLAKPYSPRYEKQRSPVSARGGMHRRGKQTAFAGLGA